MSPKAKNLFSVALKFGLYAGAAMAIVNILYYVLDVNMFSPFFGLISLFISIAVIVTFMVIGTKSLRDKFWGGKIKYLQCWLTAGLIGYVGYLIGGLTSVLIHQLIDPEWIVSQMNEFMIKMEEVGLPEDRLDSMYEKMSEGIQLQRQLLNAFVGSLAISLIISAIVAATIKKNKNEAPVEGVM